jgi:hypothetical protein
LDGAPLEAREMESRAVIGTRAAALECRIRLLRPAQFVSGQGLVRHHDGHRREGRERIRVTALHFEPGGPRRRDAES